MCWIDKHGFVWVNYQQEFVLHPALHQHSQEETCGQHQEHTYTGTPKGRTEHVSTFLYLPQDLPIWLQMKPMDSFSFFSPSSYLEAYPDGIYLCSCPGEGGWPGPDGKQHGLSSVQVKQRLCDRAFVLITGHHKVEDNEGGKAKQANDADQGKPVHLPEKESFKQTDAV